MDNRNTPMEPLTTVLKLQTIVSQFKRLLKKMREQPVAQKEKYVLIEKDMYEWL